MEKKQKNIFIPIVVAGIILILAIMIFGTIWSGRKAHQDAVSAVRSVSLLYLDELAGRREQVVEDHLNSNIDVIDIAIGLMTEEDLKSEENLQKYQARMKSLFNLERFAFVDPEGTIYTALGELHEMDLYDFDQNTISGPEISVKNLRDEDKKVVIAVPVKGISVEGKELTACFMEIDMDTMLEGISMKSQSSDSTFCNIYTEDGVALSNTVLGGLAAEDNLIEALEKADYEDGYTFEQVRSDFEDGRKGVVSFSYDGIQESLSYVPIEGTNWLLTYLIRESVISERISSVSNGIITRSLIMSILMTVVLGIVAAFIITEVRKNAKLQTAEAENRVKQEELEQRIALQEELLEQKEHQEQQTEMINALSSDYRSVYFLELDKDRGICYQARDDMPGLKVGDTFNYLEAVTAFCNTYILEEYREDFLKFIQPDSIREGLKDSRVISYRYMINVNGTEAYEAVKFAGVGLVDDCGTINKVGACFADVDENVRKDIEQQHVLADALKAAEQASRAKTTFLSNMSHEIRTPMNAIIGLDNIALNEPDLPEKTREHLTKIGASAQHLLGIINDILDMSRIESGRMNIKHEEFSFIKSLEQVNTIISGQCLDKGISYDCHTVGKIDDYYIGDGVKLKQVMINILGNAVKFTPSGGEVRFLIEEGSRYNGQATLKLTISDTGIGMSKEYLPHLFETFSQEDASSTNKFGSTGLGMPITKSIVELMNGHIEVESEKGVGTTFRVTVTLGESDRKADTGLDGHINTSDLSVLAIDDDPIALEHAQLILKQVGISCDVALSGEEGIKMVEMRHARRNDYDLLLVDWKMPDIDGVETTRHIRQIVGQETPIIILTSYNWDEVEDEARRAGVDTFVPKPLFAGSVLEEFREAFKRKSPAFDNNKADLTGRCILLAEDMEVNAEIMIMVLAMREIETDLAENGRIAVNKYTEHPEGYYDAILMDMRMPEMDGLTATRLIRESGRSDAGTIPIIALTANAFDEDVQRSLQAGLNAHLSKPVEPEELFETLESLIK